MKLELKKSLQSLDAIKAERFDEENLIANFLSNKNGGTLLVSGARGSGKTTLVKSAIYKYKQKNKDKLFTRKNNIIIDLPYIAKRLGSQNDNNADVASLALRAFALALVEENNTRSNVNIPFRNRSFRYFTYNRRLKDITKMVKYTSVKESKALNINAKLRGIDAASLNRQVSVELDLTDAILEVKIRDLLYLFKDKMNFIVTFDELDKIEKTALLFEIVAYLKNLFTQCGAHFIFISSENAYIELSNRIRLEPYGREHTLYNDVLLLNNLEPSDYNNWLTSLFKQNDENKFLIMKLIGTLAWNSKRHPHDTLKMLKYAEINENGKYFIDINRLNSQLDKLDFNYLSTIEIFIDKILDDTRSSIDSSTKNILNRVLYETANKIINAECGFNRADFLTILVNEDDFQSGDYLKELTVITSFQDFCSKQLDQTDWRQQLTKVSETGIQIIEDSIIKFIWYLEQSNHLVLELAYDDVLKIKFIGDGFHIENIFKTGEPKGTFNSWEVDTFKEDSLLNGINLDKQRQNYLKISTSTISSPMVMYDTVNGKYKYESLLKYRFKIDRDELVEEAKLFRIEQFDNVIDEIVNKLEGTFRILKEYPRYTLTNQRSNPYYIHFKTADNEIDIVETNNNIVISMDNTYYNKSVKVYRLDTSFNNAKSCINNCVRYIEKLEKI